MEQEIEIIQSHLRSNPPKCIRGFVLGPAELPEFSTSAFKTVWSLSCPCGGKTGAFLGYSPERFIPDYVIARDGPEFLSPLAFDCSACGRVIELLDTDLHGYHCEVDRLEGQVGGGTKYRGEGTPDRFTCSQCGGVQFEIIVGFVYWDAAIDLMLDEPELSAEDFFNEFLSVGVCKDCGHRSRLTDFGKL